MLAAAVVMFVINRPRMDAVALLLLVAMPLTGIIIMNEVHRRGAPPQRLARRQGGRQWSGLPILLMAAVGRLGSLMSSTTVVAIFRRWVTARRGGAIRRPFHKCTFVMLAGIRCRL